MRHSRGVSPWHLVQRSRNLVRCTHWPVTGQIDRPVLESRWRLPRAAAPHLERDTTCILATEEDSMTRQMITALALAALTAGVAYAQHVTTDSDPAAPFATYKTYAWTPGTAADVSLTEQRIHDGVNAQLQGKGMTQVDSNPNVFVATHVTTHAVPQVIADGFGPWGFGGGMATVQTYTEGSL